MWYGSADPDSIRIRTKMSRICNTDSYMKKYSVADTDPGFGAFLTPGSGIRNRFFSDPGSQPHIFEIGPNFFLQHFKTKIIYKFVKLVATYKGMTEIFFHPSFLFLFLDPGSGMGKNQDPGSGINNPDPQH
jgi:hypothetical protein